MQKKEGRLLLRLTASTWRHNPRRRELQSTAGPPGSSGDAGVWKWCKLSKEIAADQFLPELHRKIVFGGRYILGDSAFANSVWLLTPFDAPSTRSQRFFNYKHSQTRFIVEHAFGRLRWKFICLKNRMYFKIEKVPGVVQACVALYNLILVHEESARTRRLSMTRRREERGVLARHNLQDRPESLGTVSVRT